MFQSFTTPYCQMTFLDSLQVVGIIALGAIIFLAIISFFTKK